MSTKGNVMRASAFLAGLFIAYLLSFTGLGIFGTQTIVAATSDLSRSFNSETKIEPGTLVSVEQNKDSFVTGANTKNAEQLVGVAVLTDNSLLAVNSGANKAQVAVSGQATTIVSDLNGDIAAGDMIAVTPFTGVGAKALPGDRVVGVAQASFKSTNAGTKKIKVTDLKGKSKEISVGTIPVVISVGNAAVSGVQQASGNGIQNLAANIAGKPVSLLRVALCLIIGLAAIISLVVVVNSTVRNGIAAVARNPLAKPAIFDSMAQVMVMIAFIAVVSIVLMYAVLRI